MHKRMNVADQTISGTNVEVIGVLFATIWASSAQPETEVHHSSYKTSSSSRYNSNNNASGGTMSRVQIGVSVTRQTAIIPTITSGQTLRSSTTAKDSEAETAIEIVEIEMSSLKELKPEREDSSIAPSFEKDQEVPRSVIPLDV
ncbi:hypothetical protein D9758_007560 [Tetrapyrgos nigripes]|uniref:Uncharacterized protein n=1 Tax=Tetrapyrgos nigripes TaxID=182062 RepID=A0A8H5G845_9AGAR|nr:hypothetical protein D9758_007560 [Tetrapyrgos nigripes]